MSDPLLTQCPACGAATFVKQVTAAGFQLKGSGWYVTDFRDGGAKKDKSKVRLEHLQEVFKDGALTRHEAGQKLEAVASAGRSAVSEALNKRFADMLEKLPGGLLINLKPEYRPEPSPFDEGAED